MQKIQGFFDNIFKGKSLEAVGGLQGLLDKIGALSKDGNVELATLKKFVMPYAGSFMPGSVKNFFAENKGKTDLPKDDVLEFFRTNMKPDAPAKPATNGEAEKVAPETPAATDAAPAAAATNSAS